MITITKQNRRKGKQTTEVCMKPIVGITMGDPASIGPEITIKALAEKEVYEKCRPVVIGDLCVMEKAHFSTL